MKAEIESKKEVFFRPLFFSDSQKEKGINGVLIVAPYKGFMPFFYHLQGVLPLLPFYRVSFDAGATRTFDSLTIYCIYNKYTTLL